jgi:hypothetical protein
MTKTKTQIHRGYLEALARREEHLRERIAQAGGESLSYDKHEAAALRWAIKVLSELLDLQEAKESRRDMSAIR